MTDLTALGEKPQFGLVTTAFTLYIPHAQTILTPSIAPHFPTSICSTAVLLCLEHSPSNALLLWIELCP